MEVGYGSPRRALLRKKGKVERSESATFRLGSAVHALVLEGEAVFNSLFQLKKDARTEKDKLARQELLDAGWSLLPKKEWETVHKIAAAVDEYPNIMEYLTGSVEVEKSVFFEYEGIQCKARLDIVNHDKKVIIDLKSTVSANPAKFKYSIKNYDYDVQAAFYREGLYRATGEYYNYVIIAVEKEESIEHSLFTIDHESVFLQAMEKINHCFDVFNHCLNDGFRSYNFGLPVQYTGE